jgi:hypothetical protein
MDEFVLRPGRSAVLWNGKAKRLTVKVQSPIAVSVAIEDNSRTLRLSQPAFEHELAVALPKRQSLKVTARNVSGTRKARGGIEIIAR